MRPTPRPSRLISVRRGLRRAPGISPAPTISPMPGCGVGGRTQPPVALVIEFGTHLLVPLQRRLLRCQLFSDHCR